MVLDDVSYARIKFLVPVFCIDLIIKRKEDGKMLLCRRKNDPREGEWWVPGGRVFRMEKVRYAVERKLKEETGYKLIAIPRIVGFMDNLYVQSHTPALVFLVHVDGKIEPSLDTQHDAWRWVSDGSLVKSVQLAKIINGVSKL
jgi:colanic acid biosynthesis protein WcaH